MDVIEKLLRTNKVDVNAKSVDGETALYIASAAGHEDVVKKLLENDNVDTKIKKTKDQQLLKRLSRIPLFAVSRITRWLCRQ